LLRWKFSPLREIKILTCNIGCGVGAHRFNIAKDTMSCISWNSTPCIPIHTYSGLFLFRTTKDSLSWPSSNGEEYLECGTSALYSVERLASRRPGFDSPAFESPYLFHLFSFTKPRPLPSHISNGTE
jgi:hypothetical protein